MIHGSSSLQIPAISDHDIQAWIASLAKHFSAAEVKQIEEACELASLAYASQFEETGLPLIHHATGTAAILVTLNMDAETIAAALLFATPKFIDNWQETLKARFGIAVFNLVAGLMHLEQVQTFSDLNKLNTQDKDSSEIAKQIESLRKMLLAMVQDIRVVLIKLAERTQTLRSLANTSTIYNRRLPVRFKASTRR